MIDRLRIFYGRRVSYKFLATILGIVGCVFVVVLFFLARSFEEHIMDQVKKQALILYKQIVITRRWVADHGVIYVRKPDAPDAERPVSEKERDGTARFSEVSPSTLTKILADRAAEQECYSFRIADTKPLNPVNSADKEENEALTRFRSGDGEGLFSIQKREGATVLRYIAPLYITPTCMQCHANSNAQPGEVGGCISVFIPMDAAKKAIERNKAWLVGGGSGFALCLTAMVFVGARSVLLKRIQEIQVSIERMRRNERVEDSTGDELKEISDFCYLINDELDQQRSELEQKIAHAVRDLSATNARLASVNRELEGLNRAKSEFFSDISHELRTPLTNIKGAADFLARKRPGTDSEYIDIIKRNSDHLIKIVLDFLDYSKMEAGRFELDIEHASLETALREAAIAHKYEAMKRNVAIVVRCPEDMDLPMDRKRIFQVLSNLLSNAVRFAPEFTEILMRADVFDPRQVSVTVTDAGPGIDPLYHANIFKKFYQVKGQEHTNKGSSGIGLAICKGIVEAHGGAIWVNSQPAGGCTFGFTLPKVREG